MTASEKIYVGYPFMMLATVTDSELLADATALKIRYLKPSSHQYVEQDAEIVAGTTDTLGYKVTADENDAVGEWTYWAYVENSVGDGMPSTPIGVEIFEEGT